MEDSLSLSIQERVDLINSIRETIHEYSPFKTEPVDFVKWVQSDNLQANDYNPNRVAPPEMKLLRHSIFQDGYTQPIVSWPRDDIYEVVDGFHRNRIGKEDDEVRNRIHGYLPITVINANRESRNDRIASTIRHNRARGKHVVDGMSEIVLELKNRNWTNERIARELGMDMDEILRLCQITGLANLFADHEFSKSWDIEDAALDEEGDVLLSDEIEDIAQEKEKHGFRSANTSDENRIFHTWDKWECYKAGFYKTHLEGRTQPDAEQEYAYFLSNIEEFEDALEHVTTEWKHSCEHYLTNSSLNRIAWLGQASACYARGLPAVYRGGFNLLTEKQQKEANEKALEYLNKWLVKNSREPIEMETALSGKQVDLY